MLTSFRQPHRWHAIGGFLATTRWELGTLGLVYPRTFYTDLSGLLCKATEGANLQG
jgi:hypothetical protein